MKSSVDLTIERPGIAVLRLSDPKRRNALSAETIAHLLSALDAVDSNDDIRVAVLTGAGNVFCSGGDLTSMDPDPVASVVRDRMRTGIQRIPRRLAFMEKPVLAAINGPAIGAGLDLALACDIRLAAERAVFSAAFVNVGLVAADGGGYLLPRIVGSERAADLLFTGRRIDASEAARIGLVSVVVPDELLEERTLDLGAQIAEKSPVAVRLIKRLIRSSASTSLDDGLELAAALAGLSAATDEHRAAVSMLQAASQSASTTPPNEQRASRK